MTSITCPFCDRTSYNSNDVKEKYCGFCNIFHDDALGASPLICGAMIRFCVRQAQVTTEPWKRDQALRCAEAWRRANALSEKRFTKTFGQGSTS